MGVLYFFVVKWHVWFYFVSAVCEKTLGFVLYWNLNFWLFSFVSRWSADSGPRKIGSPELHDMLAEYIYSESPEAVILYNYYVFLVLSLDFYLLGSEDNAFEYCFNSYMCFAGHD